MPKQVGGTKRTEGQLLFDDNTEKGNIELLYKDICMRQTLICGQCGYQHDSGFV